MKVRDFLTTANTELGGWSTSYTAATLDAITGGINGSFDSGAPSTFAQQNPRNGTCP
jgi:hypothetical protein